MTTSDKKDKPFIEQLRFSYIKLLLLLFITNSILLAQIDTTWVRRFNEQICGIEYAYAITTDIASNAYVTGWSGTAGIPDFLTIKISSTGETLWTRKYNGPAGDGDWAYAICVDNQGNLYVTGESDGIGTNSDYAVIKYNASGVEQWVVRYNGTGNGADYATAICVDNQGNVYVTGASDGGSSDYDYLTIKYNASGIEQWVRRYNGTGNMDDIANCLVVDNSGNVYISGESEGDDNIDYVTIKYNSNGVQQWLRSYDGIGDSYDYAYAITIDGSGNVYVTGASGDIDADYDYATVKYNSSGVQQWSRRFDGTGNDDDYGFWVAVDASGNVYVTGSSYGETSAFDCATIKYNAAGTRQWVARYNGSGNDNDYAYMLAIDNLGNVYVTGESFNQNSNFDYTTVKYNNAGVQQWVQRFDGSANQDDYASAITLDGSFNVYVTGGSISNFTDLDFLTIKYNLNGIEQWQSYYNGVGQSLEQASAISIDNNDDIYVVGASTGSGTANDYLTVKYNGMGQQEWAVRHNSVYNGNDNPYAIAIDNLNNIYITGESFTNSINYDVLTVKYNLNGACLWSQRYDGPRQRYDWANALAVDSNNNVYITGGTDNINTDYDYLTVKYDALGNLQWVKTYNGNANSIDYSNAICCDNVGNVYVTGASYVTTSSYDCVTIKYNAVGDTQWIRRYNGTANNSDAGTAIKTDAAGNVYVTGRSFGVGTSRDFITIKYSASGQELWTVRYNGTANGEDGAISLIVDDYNIYVTGWSYGVSSGRDYLTIKYNSDGIEQWVARYNGIGNRDDVPSALITDSSGNIYITGTSDGVGTYTDYLTVKYNSSGQEQWVYRYNGPKSRNDKAAGIAINNLGDVYITGTSEGNGTANDFATIKCSQAQGLNESLFFLNDRNMRLDVYPNPFKQEVTISYSVPIAEKTAVQIFDIIGRLIVTFQINKNNRSGIIKWNGTDQENRLVKSGVYFCIIQNDTQLIRKKIMMLK